MAATYWLLALAVLAIVGLVAFLSVSRVDTQPEPAPEPVDQQAR